MICTKTDCPAALKCTRVNYRGSECAAKRDKFGLGDPGPRNGDVRLAYRTIRDYCRLRECDSSCYLYKFCGANGPFSMTSPRFWPDQEEGGGEDG